MKMVCAILVAVPWLFPFAFGPLPAMWPDLFAWAVAAVLFVLMPTIRLDAGKVIASGWAAAAIASAVLALLQYFDLENGLYPYIAMTMPGNAYGNVFQTNLLATLLSIGLLSIWWLNEAGHLKNLIAALMGGLILVALAATVSRTGGAHLVLIAGLMLCWHGESWRRWLLIILVAGLVYLTATFLLPLLLQEFVGVVAGRDLLARLQGDYGCASRKVLWSNVIHLISLKPWSGWGGGGLLFAHYITPFEEIRFCAKLSNAHNLFLHVAVERGVPVAIVLLMAITVLLVKLAPWKVKKLTERFAWGVLLLIGFHSMVEYPMWYGVFQLMTGLAVWLIWVERRTHSAMQRELGIEPRFAPWRWAVSCLSLTLLAYAGWDYARLTQLFTPQSERSKQYQVDTFNQINQTLLFKSQVLLAQVQITEVDQSNAQPMLNALLEVLRIAPDSRIIRKVIEAAQLLGRQDLVQLHVTQYKAAWPKEFEEWLQLSNSH